MINYSIDTLERERVYVALALCSVVGVSFINSLLAEYKIHEYSAPSAMVVFLLLMGIYDKFIWRYASLLGLSSIPDMNGTWDGSLTKNNGDSFPVSMHIHQTWRQIQVSMDTDVTTGSLQVASISVSNPTRPIAKWIYNLRPKNYALSEGYNPHAEGVNEFRLHNKGKELTLDGSYYSSQFRGGQIILTKRKK